MNQRRLKIAMVWVTLVFLCAAEVGCNLSEEATQSGPGITPPGVAATEPYANATAIFTATDTASATASSLPTDQPTATATVAHLVKPGEPPPAFESQIYDLDSSGMAALQRVMGGDSFGSNTFERPFDQSMKTYFADLDIKQAGLNRDTTWTYATLTLANPTAQSGFPGDYGLEIDVNRDGRGDFLIMAAAPGADWSTNGVSVWQDKNHDVGGATPILSDPLPQTGDGYETRLFSAGQGADPDLAWARISPGNPANVLIAFKRSLFNDANPFMWGAWAMEAGQFHADWFDYNDHFSQAQAGSPLGGSANYPLKAFFEVDNTCRWVVGFTPTGNEPGICPVAQPTPTFTLMPTLTPTVTLKAFCTVGSKTNPCLTQPTLPPIHVAPTSTPTRTRTPTRTPTRVITVCHGVCK